MKIDLSHPQVEDLLELLRLNLSHLQPRVAENGLANFVKETHELHQIPFDQVTVTQAARLYELEGHHRIIKAYNLLSRKIGPLIDILEVALFENVEGSHDSLH